MDLVEYFPALSRPSAPLCSVCIANYNGEGLLRECIESVLRQDGCSEDVEILVHDDASTDESVQLLRREYPQVTVIASNENVGFCVANNRMASYARGEFLLLLNNDAALALDAISKLQRHASEQKPQGILSLPQYDWESGKLVDRGCLLDPFYNPVPIETETRRDVGMVIGACLWIPRALWTQLGGFPEWFESIAEDLYLCCLARLTGHPVQVTATSYYRHRQGVSFGGNRAGDMGLRTTYRRRRLSERNKTYALAICCPPATLWVWLPVHLLALSAEGLALSIIKRDARLWGKVYLGVWRALWNNRVRLGQERRRVQALRRVSLREYLEGFTVTLRKLSMLRKHGLPNVR